jgi:hypothetical protein
MTPPRTTANRKFSKPPRDPMEVNTMAASPAAGPLTPRGEPLKAPTIIPPIIPEIKPENKGAPLANAIPRQRGKATKKTTILAGMSDLKFLKGFELFIGVIIRFASCFNEVATINQAKYGFL